MTHLRSLAFSALLVGSLSAAAAGEEAWEFVAGASTDGFQSQFDRLVGDGFRPLTVQSSEIDGEPVFHALFVKDNQPTRWVMRHVMSPRAWDEEENAFRERGDRAIAFAATRREGQPCLSVIGVGDGGRRRWEAVEGLGERRFEEALERQRAAGLMPESISPCATDKGPRFAALYVESAGRDWEAGADLTEAQARRLIEQSTAKGLQPLSIQAVRTERGPRFAVVVANDATERRAVFPINPAGWEAERERQQADGFRPRSMTSWEEDGEVKSAAIFEKPPTRLPVTGAAEPKLAAFDQALEKYLQDENLRGATLAVSRNGRLLLSRGYGFKDAEELEPMPPDALLRIASVSKPLTAIAARKLIQDGKLDADAKVFDLLELSPPPGRDVDPRWKDVTVEHLIRHRGGWDRKAELPGYPDGFDPMFYPEMIGKALGQKPPLTAGDFVRYMAGQPLQFEPGSKYAYSNFGYCVLGRVIEKASGRPYGDYLEQEVFQPLGVTELRLGRSLVPDRDPREPVYRSAGEADNVVTGEPPRVRWPDGGFLLEAMDSHGGWIASAPHLAKVFEAYWISGQPRGPDERESWNHFGSLPGTFTVAHQRKDGVTIVVLLNQRNEKNDERILEVMNTATDAVTDWPE